MGSGCNHRAKLINGIPFYLPLKLTFIKEGAISERLYQENIAEVASRESTLVVLPTGMGKTVIALKVIDRVLWTEGGRVLFMAPTKPLVEQHFSFLTEKLQLPEGEIVTMTGEVSPERRAEWWRKARIVVSTPQVVENDINSGAVWLRDFSLVVFDECHRAVGDYSYVHIAEIYTAEKGDGLVLGMTASPGSDLLAVEGICRMLGIRRIEARTEDDPDVEPYVQDVAVKWVEVQLPEALRRISRALRKMLARRVDALKRMDLLPEDFGGTTRELLGAGRRISDELAAGHKSRGMFEALRIQSEAIKIAHGIDLAETQAAHALRQYVSKLQEEAGAKKSKASVSISQDEHFVEVVQMLEQLREEHPKMAKLRETVEQQLLRSPGSRIMVFTQYRDTADAVERMTSSIAGARPLKLVGQSAKGSKKGLRQKEQIDVISRFAAGAANVLISTSVGEEGLDIASTDMVVFFEPVPSEIRTIQRKGRTGRLRAGKVVVLITKETKDEGYYYSSKRKERAMKAALMSLNMSLQGKAPVRAQVPEKQKKLFDF